ncbi:MAG: peptidoglycan-binding protein [Aquamicrobium sp.]|uniref:peptidoglycan-binding protein n=1 Tax=Aquamicrobium sp. TaxID=1872579 RepID=UPI00349E93B5|nr:peptidoglycan-binding protein [Aquamicrobium sp.]
MEVAVITEADLRKFLPKAKAALVAAVAGNWHEAEAAGITSPRRIRQFLSNIATETGGLTSIVESLTYTSAQRIYDVFKGPATNRRFKSVAECQSYVRNAKALAIKVYGGRMGNAPAPSTDGWDFRGGGMLQTTGREGYRNMGFEGNPGALQSNPKLAFLAAVREWKKRGCNELADRNDTEGVRKAINGGTNGLSDVRTYLARAVTVWPDNAKPAGVPGAITNPVVIREAQVMLKALGYTEVGGVDGVIGTMTRGAILAFRAENGLPLTPTLDDEFMRALKVAQPRQIAKERVLASVSVVAEKVPEVKANMLSKILSATTAAVSSFFAAIVGIFDQFDDARGYIDPLKGFAAGLPGWLWLVLLTLLALSIFMISRNGEKKGVEAFQSGERR